MNKTVRPSGLVQLEKLCDDAPHQQLPVVKKKCKASNTAIKNDRSEDKTAKKQNGEAVGSKDTIEATMTSGKDKQTKVTTAARSETGPAPGLAVISGCRIWPLFLRRLEDVDPETPDYFISLSTLRDDATKEVIVPEMPNYLISLATLCNDATKKDAVPDAPLSLLICLQSQQRRIIRCFRGQIEGACIII